jgi:hypothetical protein
MTAAISPTVVGVFTDRKEAEAAIANLREAGFREDQIGVAVRADASGEDEPAAEEGATRAAEGGVGGVLAGGAAGGLLAAVAAGLVPGIGPVLSAGILVATVGGTALGGVVGGLAGVLIGHGIPEHEAHHYQGELAAGRTIVTVKVDGRHDEAVAILRRHGALGRGSPLI